MREHRRFRRVPRHEVDPALRYRGDDAQQARRVHAL